MAYHSVTQLKPHEISQENSISLDFYTTYLNTNSDNEPSLKVCHRGDSLYEAGDNFESLYVLVSGSAKTFLLSVTGELQITGFMMPGDIIGLDGFDGDRYACSVSFLETSAVRCISINQLNKVLVESSSLNKIFTKLVSQSIKDKNHMMFSLCKLDSEQRMVNFLPEQSKIFKLFDFFSRIFNLSMSRSDIANFLGISVETASRLKTKLQRKRMINVNGRQIVIKDIEKFRKYSEGSGGSKNAFYSHHQTRNFAPIRRFVLL
ncbi:MAG: CRP/FNR family transcriptional regulator [Flavobacteriales bacterium]|jgi:CRP/FNR family transcriptional regulator